MAKEIGLSQGKVTLVDEEDFDALNEYSWCFNVKDGKEHGYAQRSQHIKVSYKKYRTKVIYMHREILKTDQEVDHINGDTLDNRKENLRPSNRIMQARNSASRENSTSKFVGVHLHKLTGKWRSQIKINGKIKSLGLFSSPEDARDAREKFINENNLEWFRR